ncbi:MAG TPA: DUF1292 domain-containing protein [Candidatus Nitrosotenuis sp.]|jgi:hypothetical protein|nr:DUF1292 domain-containing protein [Candidatus Nitrosotenuis sp.]
MERPYGMVELEGSDGSSHSCQILEYFDFEERNYVVLYNPAQEALMVLRTAQRDGRTVFRSIESRDEFRRVSDFVRAMAEMLEADSR